MTVYLILAPHSQFALEQHLRFMQYDHLFQTEYMEEVFEDVSVFSKGIGEGEHIDSGWYLFDQTMLSTKKHSSLLIDLSSEMTIIDTETSETSQGNGAVDVVTTVEGIEEEAVFHMVLAPSGRWRVYQVIVAGGNAAMIPWAVPAMGE